MDEKKSRLLADYLVNDLFDHDKNRDIPADEWKCHFGILSAKELVFMALMRFSFRKTIPNGVRFTVLKRDGFKCKYCGKSPSLDGVRLEVDHVIPVSCGGRNEIDNLATSCVECNSGKRDRVL